MPIGPALVLGALGVLGLVAAMGGAKKANASPGTAAPSGGGQTATVTSSSGNTYTTKLVNTVGTAPDREHIVDVFADGLRIIRYAQNVDTKMRRYIGSPLEETDPRVIQARRDFGVEGSGLSPAPTPKPSGGAVKPINVQEGGRPMPAELLELLGKTLQGLHVDHTGNVTSPPTPEAIQAATGVAVTLKAAGYPEAAQTVLDIVERAKKLVPPPPPAAQIPLPAIPTALAEKVQRALQLEGDPAVLRALAAQLKQLPAKNDPMVQTAIQMLEAKALQLDASRAAAEGMKQIDDVLKSPGLPTAQPGTVFSPPSPATVPAPTVTKSREQLLAERLAGHLIAIQGNDVKKAKGKEDKALVMNFQKQEKLTQDGKMGPGSTTALAKYVSALPLVMYWPKGATQKKVYEYRAKINELADDAEAAGNVARATALRTSAARERGQAGIVGPMPA